MSIEDLSVFAKVLEDLKGQLLTYMLLAFALVLGVIILTTAVNELARLRGNESRERLIRQHRSPMQPQKAARGIKKAPSPLKNLRAAYTGGDKNKT
jgi:hypothetical protein